MTKGPLQERQTALRSQPNLRCFACGPENPHGLRLRFQTLADESLTAEWNPSQEWEGFPGIVHGGIVSTVLDEAMSQAIVSRSWQALTCELRVRLRQHVAAGAVFSVRAWVVEKRKRRIRAEAALLQGSVEAAHAWGTFLELTGRGRGS